MVIVIESNKKEYIDLNKKINCKLYDVHCKSRRRCLACFRKMQKLIIEGLNPVEAQNKAYEGFNQPCDKYESMEF